MGLHSMAGTLIQIYASPDFLNLDPLTTIAKPVEPDYQAKKNKHIANRLRAPHLLWCPQELSSCVDSAEREYLHNGITGTLSTLDLINQGLNVCIWASRQWQVLSSQSDWHYSLHGWQGGLQPLRGAFGRAGYAERAGLPEIPARMKRICGLDLLILDDFLLHTISDEREVKILFEILEKRSR